MPAMATIAPIFVHFSLMSSSRFTTRDKVTMDLLEMKDARVEPVRRVVAVMIVSELEL